MSGEVDMKMLLFAFVIFCFASNTYADTTDKIEREEFIKKAREDLEELKKSTENLKALSESVGKFNSDRRNKCIQAFGHEKFCRCLSDYLHMGLGMVDYVKIITMDKNKLNNLKLTEDERGAVNSAIRIRKRCVRETINIGTYDKSDAPEVKREYWDNGKLKSESHFKNKKREGLTTLWWRSGGRASESHFKNGIINGVSILWHENGVKEAEFPVKNGKQEGLETRWHKKTGKKRQEILYVNDKKNGVEKEWYENGRKKFLKHYKNSVLDGMVTEWYIPSKKKSTSHYKNGIENGIRKEWDEDGTLTFEGNYIDGAEEIK